MSIKLNSVGGGSVTIQEPNTASDFTLSVPARTGTTVLQDGSNNLLMNSGYGSDAVAYGCRAWVNFNGTGTVAIRASGNVSSITDHGAGQYTTNFVNAMPDANYCVQATGDHLPGAYIVGGAGIRRGTLAVSSVRTDFISDGNQLTDMEIVCVSIFR